MSGSPITSVSENATQGPVVRLGNQSPTFSSGSASSNGEAHSSSIQLSVRGKTILITREELASLPESILLCLFPAGIMLEDSGFGHPDDVDLPVIHADYDPAILKYILDFYKDVAQEETSEPTPEVQNQIQPTIPGKAGVIVLKEDMEFFPIPASDSGLDRARMEKLTKTNWSWLKLKVGQALVDMNSLFDGLRRSAQKASNADPSDTAENHLIEMLCASGLQADGKWARRNLEPHQSKIVSLSLTVLNPDPDEERLIESQGGVTTAQKLLLFWRKPASWTRKTGQRKYASKFGFEESGLSNCLSWALYETFAWMRKRVGPS